VATRGFRADREVFAEALAGAMEGRGAEALRYGSLRSVQPDLSFGRIVHTGRDLDVALTGEDGFFVVRTPDGDHYTRAGKLVVTPDGRVTTPDGHAFVGTDRKPLRVPPGATHVGVSTTGALVVDGAETNARLLVVRFPNPAGLEKAGHVLLRAGAEAGRPDALEPALEVGALELSNASAVEGMTTLVTASRQFEMLSRVIEAFAQVERGASNIMGSR